MSTGKVTGYKFNDSQKKTTEYFLVELAAQAQEIDELKAHIKLLCNAGINYATMNESSSQFAEAERILFDVTPKILGSDNVR